MRGHNISYHKDQVSANTEKLGIEALSWKVQGAQLWHELRVWGKYITDTRFKPISTTCVHKSDTQGLQGSHGSSIEKSPCGHFLSHHQLFQMNNHTYLFPSNYNHLINLRTEQKASTLKKFDNNLLRLRPWLCRSSKTKVLNVDPPKIYSAKMLYVCVCMYIYHKRLLTTRDS